MGAWFFHDNHEELRKRWLASEEESMSALRVPVGHGGGQLTADELRALGETLSTRGACVLRALVPLRSPVPQQQPSSKVSKVCEGITFQGRPLMDTEGRIRWEVAGAAIGSALAMPLLIPGSFLAGALVGQSSGHLLSFLRSVEHPTVSSLLDAACSSINQQPGSHGFPSSDELMIRTQSLEARSQSPQPPEQLRTPDQEPPAETETLGEWLGSAISLVLFGPLAFASKCATEPKCGMHGESSKCVASWQSWCFFDEDDLTDEGVTPEVAALMEEVHEASWQSQGEGTRLLSTSAASQLPDKVMTLSVLRSAQKYWLPLVEQQVSDQSSDNVELGPRRQSANYPSRKLALHRAQLLWASMDPPEHVKELGGAGISSWSWRTDAVSLSAPEKLIPLVSRHALQQGNVDGFSVVLPLVVPEASVACGPPGSSPSASSWSCANGLDFEIVAGSHLGAANLRQTALTRVDIAAGDALVMDNRLWRRLRLHSPAYSGTTLLLVFEYRCRDPLQPGLWEVALWSVASWCALAHRAVSVVNDCTRGCSGEFQCRRSYGMCWHR